MKKTVTTLMLLMLFAYATVSTAADAPSADQGKELFESTKLGTNGKSCSTCHPGGKKLEWAATYEDEKLADIVNSCIQKALKGKPIPADSDSMKSMLSYIHTFAGPGR